MWSEVKKIETSGVCCSFLDAIDVWTNKPHVVNRNLCAAKILWQHLHLGNIAENVLQVAVTDSDILKQEHLNTILKLLKRFGIEKNELKLYLRDLLPKSLDKFAVLREIVIIDVKNAEAIYIPYERKDPNDTVSRIAGEKGYRLQLGEDAHSIILHICGYQDDYRQSELGYAVPWLESNLLPKIASWSTTTQLNTAVTSLKLVPVDRYNQLYQELKKKYGAPLVKVWPESTDPQKFVYEDVAIATYLLLLWEEDRRLKKLDVKQSFVDLGCGNGLLVYILTSEGHRGLGLDLRKRKIWDFFGEKFDLQEREIIPSDESLFPEYDWLIGNHSDELTPWIPVMAARSSQSCSYFVLPCCPHDFSAKFSQKVTGVSQYRAYLDFVAEVGEACGFNVQEDTLRIPSTKRVCFIGKTRNYKPENELEMDEKRQAYINHRCSMARQNTGKMEVQNNVPSEADCTCISVDPDTKLRISKDMEYSKDNASAEHGCEKCDLKRKWTADFQARDSNQKVRNCVTVPHDIKDKITRTVFDKLLCMEFGKDMTTNYGQIWNEGGSLPLSDVASLFDQDTLQQMKSECGGLQTMLRNSHHIFRVQGGHVQLRDWRTDDYDQHQRCKRRKKGKPVNEDIARLTKTKCCYFFDNHPDGCPLSSEQCRFAHGNEELRTVIIKT